MVFRPVVLAMLVALVCCIGAIWSGTAQAQALPAAKTSTEAVAALPDPLTPEAIRELVSRLNDEDVRALLLRQLDAAASRNGSGATAGQHGIVDLASQALFGVWAEALGSVRQLPALAADLHHGFSTFIGKAGWHGLAALLATLAGIVAVAIGAERLVLRRTDTWRTRMTVQEQPATLRATLLYLWRRFLSDMIGLFTFLAVTRLLAGLLIPDAAVPLAHSIMLNLVVVPRLVAALSRFLFAPDRPQLRLVSIDDWSARFLHRNLIGLMVLVGLSTFLITFMDANDAPAAGQRLGFWLTSAIFGWLLFMAVRARRGLAQKARGWEADLTPLEARLADAYPWAMMALIVAGWLAVEIMITQGRTDLLQAGKPFVTLALLMLTPTMDTAIRGLVRHLAPPMQGEGPVAEAAWISTKRSYVRIGRLVTFGAVVMAIAGLWGLDFADLASAGVGIRFAARFVTFLLILAAGYLLWEIVTLAINRRLANEMTIASTAVDAEESGAAVTAASRLTTVLPIARFVLQTTVIVLTVLIALGNVGIDITPLLAGAGILGLAIGFGAQTLVRDVVSGLFFLIDDAFRIGEYIAIDSTVGTVEKISIRSLQLRHDEGPVHTIPYGEIPRVTNNSRDWVIVKMKFTVPFDADINKIRKIFKQIGKEVLEQPYAGDVIQTFKSQGVSSVDDVGMVVRGKFQCKPGRQFVIRKDIYSRIQKAFAENGIEFARREVRVSIPGLDQAGRLGDEERDRIRRAAGAAAAADLAQTAAGQPDAP